MLVDCLVYARAKEIILHKGLLSRSVIGISLEDYNKTVDAYNEECGPTYEHLTQEEFDAVKDFLMI